VDKLSALILGAKKSGQIGTHEDPRIYEKCLIYKALEGWPSG